MGALVTSFLGTRSLQTLGVSWRPGEMKEWSRHWDSVVIIVIAVGLASVMYSDWFIGCCRKSADFVGPLLLPAVLIASVIGNGVHNASAVHFTIGLALEFLVLWWLAKYLFTVWRSRAK